MSYNPDRINIHELTVEEPEKPSELPFDPERDITEEDWGNMKNSLRKQSVDIAYHALNLEIITPGVVRELALNNVDWQRMKVKLDLVREAKNPSAFAEEATAMKILFPERSNELNLDEEIWTMLNDHLNKVYRKGNHWYDFSHLAVEMLILFPHRAVELNLNKEAWKGIHGELLRCVPDGDSFYISAKNMKLLFPSNMNELVLDKKIWDALKRGLKDRKKWGDWAGFSSRVMAMKILAAEEVKITEKGIEINMHVHKEGITTEIPPTPETKQF